MKRIFSNLKNRLSIILIPLILLSFPTSSVYAEWTLFNLPYVSSYWSPLDVHFTSSNEGWAVGGDYENIRGVLLHYFNGSWEAINPPYVSKYWTLESVHFTSSNEGWAVGRDASSWRGVLLHYFNGSWTVVSPPPYASSGWGLYSVHFTSPNEGWAVGQAEDGKGVLLHYSNGSWTSVTPPYVSQTCNLNSVHFTSANEGWAVGNDPTNEDRGVLLHYYNGSWTIVPPPDDVGILESVQLTSSDKGWAVGYRIPPSGAVLGALLRYSNGSWEVITPPPYESSEWGFKSVHFTSPNEGWAVGEDWNKGKSSKGVLFHYYNGTWIANTTPYVSSSWRLNSVFFTSPNEGWAFGTDLETDGGLSPERGILLKYIPPIYLITPSNNAHFDVCSLYALPTFTYNLREPFNSYEIQFSPEGDFSSIPVKVRASGIITEVVIKLSNWKKVLLIPGVSGGTVYWKIVGTRADKTKVESNISLFEIEEPKPVGNLSITSTSKSLIPNLTWENNCNRKFKAWFYNDPDYYNDPTKSGVKKKALSFNINNPNDNGGIFTRELTSGQWVSIRKLVGDIRGATIYWHVESWDGVKRDAKTEGMNFTLND